MSETRISLEDNEEMRTAWRLDLQDKLMSEGRKEGVGDNVETRDKGTGGLEAGGSGVEEDELSDGRGAWGTAAVVPPPAYSNVAERFGVLEDGASASAMHDVLFYLRKAKLSWMNARSNTTNKRQTRLFEFINY